MQEHNIMQWNLGKPSTPTPRTEDSLLQSTEDISSSHVLAPLQGLH